MKVRIERNIPIPPATPKKKKTVYPWDDIDIGESFVHKGESKDVRTQASICARRYGKRFVVRKIKKGCRVWRVSLSYRMNEGRGDT